jgi:hypothetical protein
MEKTSAFMQKIQDAYNSIPGAVRTGVLGAGLAGIGTGLATSLTPARRDEDQDARRKRILQNAAVAAALGGGTAAGLHVGMDYIGNPLGAEDKTLGEKAWAAISHPFVRGGAAATGITGLVGAKRFHASAPLEQAKLRLQQLAQAAGKPLDAFKDFHPFAALDEQVGRMHGIRSKSVDGMAKMRQVEDLLDNVVKRSPGATMKSVLRDMISAGADVHPELLKKYGVGGSIRGIEGIGKLPLPIGRMAAGARRVGRGRLGTMLAAGLMFPELLQAGKWTGKQVTNTIFNDEE